MKYQRVLYTNKFTTELKSKLRIICYDKRRSLKGNVYYVSFASDADIAYADRVSKRLRNVTLKPFQSRCASEVQHENRMSICSHQESLASSSVPPSPSPTSFLSSSTTLTFFDGGHSKFITSEPDSLRRANETLEERAMRVLGPFIETNRDITPLPVPQTLNSISSTSDVNLVESHMSSNSKKKQQPIDHVQSCLSAMETTRRAADELCQLYKRGIDYQEALNYLFKVHSTAFYLKAATSAQIKAAFSGGLRLSWSAVSNSINVLKTDVRHEQLFMAELTAAKHILSKIDNATSIAMSSKLAYQLAKLSD